jgi:hypothetical protein
MKSMIKYLLRLLKIALVSTFGIGGGAGLLVFVIFLAGKGDQHAWLYGLTAGTVVGLICTGLFLCVMMPLDLLFRWSIAASSKTNETKTILENEQVRELILPGPSQKVHFACRQALLALPGIKNVHDDATNNRLFATTGASWRSPGEKIVVEITKHDAGRFLLHCVSSPSMNNVIFDYGKNFENVEAWKKLVQEFMKMSSSFS